MSAHKLIRTLGPGEVADLQEKKGGVLMVIHVSMCILLSQPNTATCVHMFMEARPFAYKHTAVYTNSYHTTTGGWSRFRGMQLKLLLRTIGNVLFFADSAG